MPTRARTASCHHGASEHHWGNPFGGLKPARTVELAKAAIDKARIDAGTAHEALVAFEATMRKEPNRFRGLYGGARAAEALGDRAKATAYYKKLLAVAKDADTERPELQHAKTYVGGRR